MKTSAAVLSLALEKELLEEFPPCDHCETKVLAIMGNADLDWIHIDGTYGCRRNEGTVARFTPKVLA